MNPMLPRSKAFVLRLAALMLLWVLAMNGAVTPARAQGPGVNSAGRDFYIGYMPGLRHPATWSGVAEAYYVIIGSFSNDNTVSVSYFNDDGSESQTAQRTIQKGRTIMLTLDRLRMSPTRPGEQAEYRAAHVKSRYPVTVQCYEEGSSTGGMYQAIPTNALGQQYVVSAWFDNPVQNNPGYLNRDSACSDFMVIAAYDNTKVTYTPNSTTYGGVVGVNSGRNSNGVEHPTTVTLQRGQTFWVRSESIDPAYDITGSLVESDKPVAVIAGHERALLGDPSGYWTTLDNDIRDVLVEQMTPAVSWGSDYPSIPFLPPPNVTRLLQNGSGDMYRVTTNDPKNGIMDMWRGNQAFSRNVNFFQSPAAEYDNVEEAVDFLTKSTNPDGSRKKMNVVMYDYFQGAHDWDPGGNNREKGGTGQSNGGGDVQDEVTYICANEMNLIPIDHWGMSTVFGVPRNATYKGAQFINLITNKDSLTKIWVVFNGGSPKQLSAYTKKKTYQIPLHPELTGLTMQLGPGDYMIYGNTPFACYSYGRTEGQYKDGWGYAAPCGQLYGSHDEALKPTIEINPFCDHWDVTIRDARPTDEGISDIVLLKDPDGFITKPARVSFNTTFSPADPVFAPGDSVVRFQVLINDATKPGYAAIYVVDRAGNDTTFEVFYTPMSFTVVQNKLDYKDILVGTQSCQSFTVRVNQTGASDSLLVTPGTFLKNTGLFTYTSTPSLPRGLKVGDSVTFTVCFDSKDTLHHIDQLGFGVGCMDTLVPLTANGVTPIIWAQDYDFGAVPVGTTACHDIRVENRGNADLIIDKNWVLHNMTQFSFSDNARLPITIKPHESTLLNFCFSPTDVGPMDTRQDWSDNLPPQYDHMEKDTSHLRGYAIKPGLNWDRPDQGFTVECDNNQVQRVFLINPHSPTGTDITIKKVKIEGTDAAEFGIIANQLGYTPIDANTWTLADSGSIWLDIKFLPDLSKGYRNRSAYIVAVGIHNGQEVTDTLFLNAVVRHAQLVVAPATHDFGVQVPGTKLQTTFTLTNTGDTTLVFATLNFVGPGYTIISGPAVGDKLAPGQSVDVVVEVTAPDNGQTDFVGDATGRTSCPDPAHFTAKIFGTNLDVTGIGSDLPLTYICQDRTAQVSTTNTGPKGAILEKAEIVSTATAPDADQWTFADGTSVQTINKGYGAGESQKFDLRFTPTRVGPLHAIIRYTWIDTSKTPNAPIVREYDLTSIGYQTANTVSLYKEYDNHVYTTITEGTVSVPVQLKQAFDANANIYGVELTVRYLRDQFRYLRTTSASGLSLQGSPTPVADPANNNYELLTLKFTSNSPILRIDSLAHVDFEFIVAKDSMTQFEIKDLLFLDQTGASACWVASAMVPGTFYGTNYCGDFTLREYLRYGHNSFSIRSIVPNPVTSQARVSYEVKVNGTPMTIEVYNALGQKVQTVIRDEVQDAGLYDRMIDAMTLSNGVYTVRVSSPNFEATKPLVVTK